MKHVSIWFDANGDGQRVGDEEESNGQVGTYLVALPVCNFCHADLNLVLIIRGCVIIKVSLQERVCRKR
jgi:hypothetical protein